MGFQSHFTWARGVNNEPTTEDTEGKEAGERIAPGAKPTSANTGQMWGTRLLADLKHDDAVWRDGDGVAAFAMLGTSGQIAGIIKSKSLDQMSTADRERVQQLREREWLYVNGFDHGVDGGSHLFNRKNSNDPSRADWVFEGTASSQNQQITWDFNINWGTLRFRETLTISSDSTTYYGECEAVSK